MFSQQRILPASITTANLFDNMATILWEVSAYYRLFTTTITETRYTTNKHTKISIIVANLLTFH